MDPTIRVLLLEDSDDDAEMLRRELRKAGLTTEIRRVETESAYREQLHAFSPRVVLADLALPRYDGRLALRLLRDERPETPFIFVSGSRGEELAIEALKQGATDYVLKHRLERLGPAVLRALNESTERYRRVEAESQLQRRLRYENTTSECLQILAAGEPDRETLTRVLESLRDTAQASRVYVFRHDDGDGQRPGEPREPTMSQLAEVVAAGIEPQIDNPDLQGRPYRDCAPTMFTKLLAREPYGGGVSELPGPERNLLEVQDILSALVLPIFSDGSLWGFIGFDDCLEERRWVPEDVNLLQVVADMIGVTVHRQRTVDELRLQSAVMNAAANAIVVTDARGDIRWVNPAWTRLTGYTAEECIGRNTRMLKSGVHDDRFYKELWETICGGNVWESEWVNRRKDGSLYPEHATITPVKDSSGTITHFVAIKEDVSRRKEMERSLRESEERFKMIALASNDAIWEWDLETDSLWWSEGFFTLYGYGRDELEPTIGSWMSRIHPDEAAAVIADVERAIENGESQWKFEYRFRHKDGSWRFVLDRGNVVRDGDGKPKRMYGGMTDLTARREMEQALTESEERLRMALRAGRMGTIDWNLHTDRVVYSSTFFEIFGYPDAEDGSGGPEQLLDRVHADDREIVKGERERAIRNGGTFGIEYRVVLPDDSVRWVAEHGEVTPDGSGTSKRLVGTVLEITRRKLSEQEARRHVRHTEFRSVVGATMSQPAELPELLQHCTQAMVDYLGAGFARIWTLEGDASVLELQASAGTYTHLDGHHSRIAVGEKKIGRIASTRLPHLTNTFQTDPQIGDPTWARREGLVAFAGYPLTVEDRCVGVMAMFAKRPLDDDTQASLHAVAGIIAQNIDRIQYKRRLAALNADLERRIEDRTARLSESERFNRATLDALSSHVAVFDPQGTVLTVNRAWRRFAEENGADWRTVSEGVNYLAACDRAAANGNATAAEAAEALRRLLRGEIENWDIEYPCHGPSERRWFHCRATRFFHEGEPRVLVAHENVTPMKNSEEALREAKATAEQASNAKSEFLAAMSHELRTPLNGILGMNDLLLSGDLNDKQREFVELSSTSGRLLLQLINDILDLSKIEAGKLELELRPTDIEVLLYHVVDILNPTASQKGLKLICSVSLEACVTALCDGNRLQQVLVNLISNAIKFTREGGITIHAERIDRATDQGDRATDQLDRGDQADQVAEQSEPDAGPARFRFRVADTGIGIPRDRQNRLFLRFSQVDSSTTREFGGSGLGLSICREIVELMGGRIGVESQVGQGSTFWFEIPAEVSATHARFTEYRRLLRGTRILAIDGLDRDRRHVADCLRSWGCEFAQVPDVAAAIASEHRARSAGRPFAVVLADCRLVTGNEYNQLQQLAELPGMEIFGLGTPAEDSLRSNLFAIGITTLLTDPVRPSALYDALAAAVWKSGRGQQDPETDGEGSNASRSTTDSGLRPESESAATAERDLAAEIPSGSESRGETEATLRGHVLVAEDNRINQMYIMELLKHFGLAADLATNGEEAVSAIRRQRYDLVLMDCQMPKMDGFDATRNIRRLESERGDGQRLPIIALTANAMVEDRDRCLEAGMDDYLAKPVDAARVRAMLAKFLAADPPSS